MNVWETILTVFGGVSALLALLGYLGRTAIKHWLDKDLDVHKANLRLAEVESTERLRSSLQLAAHEHQVRFTRLHEKRAEVISKLYELLREHMWSSGKATSIVRISGGTTPEQDIIEADKQRVEVYRYFMTNRIYLPVDACASIDALLEQVRHILVKYNTYQDVNQYAPAHVLREKHQVMMEAHKYFQEHVHKPLADLENAFRAILDPNTPTKDLSSA